jgi:PAS domain S-box-containing protein
MARDASGKPLYFIRVIEDVTARKEAEERYRATFDNAPVGIMHTALDGYGVLRANRKLCEMLGYTQEELLGMTSTVFVHPDYRYKDHASYAQQLLSGEIQSYASERKFVRKDGSTLWVNRTVSLVRGASGEPLYYIRVLEDTSERRRAQEEVERERTLLRTIVDAIPDLIHVKDSDGRFLLANRTWLAARGNPDADVVGTTAGDYFPAATVARMAEQDAAVMRTGEPLVDFEQRMEQHNPGGDGALARWLSTTKVPLRGPDGAIFGIAGVSRDITQTRLSDRRRAMEHAVTRALAESSSLAEAMGRVIAIMCGAMEWSYGARWEALERGTTLRRAEFWGNHDPEFDPADSDLWTAMTLDSMQGLVGRAWSERKPAWVADLDTDGFFFQRRASARRLGLKSAMAFPILVADETIGIMEFFGREARRPDETMFQILGSIGRQVGQFIQRKEAEEALQRSEAILAATFEQAGVGMAISEIGAEGQRWLRVNQKLCDILGRTREELLAMSPLELTPPGERRHAADFNEKLLRDEAATYVREKQYVRKDGQVIWASVSLAAVRGPDGRASRIVSVVQDITEQMHSQRALIESEEQFNQLAGNIPQVFWITDAAHRRVIYVSAACETVLGHTAAELKAAPRQLVDAVHPADRRRVYEARKGAATGRYDEIYRITRPDGTTRWLHDRAFPVRDAEGRVYRIAGIAEDITERRRAEDALRDSEERYRQAAEALANERNLLRSVIDAIPDDIYVKDRDLRYVLMNAKGLEIRGIRGGREIMGRSAAEFFPPTVSAGFDAEDRAIMAGGATVVNREQEVVHANGKRETQLASKVPLRDLDGNVVGAIGISRDITQLKERTEEISRLNAELEERVRERTAQLELSNRELESFAFSVSHDLRAPLRTIEGFSRILYNEYAGSMDQEGKDCLRRVQSASQRMARLIDALLSLSRITRSRIRLRPVDLSTLAREIGDELAQEDALRHVQLSVEPNMSARADASLLRAVFDNLLRNAWKFTARAKLAVIEVGSVQHEGRRAYFVRDNGVGFDMSYAGNLFGAFQRLHTEAEFPGTGIGLATVQRIIRRHGGEVWAEAQPGKGAVFYFTLGEAGPAAKELAVREPVGREAATG